MSAISIILIILSIVAVISVPIGLLVVKYWRFPKKTNTIVEFEDTSRTNGCAMGYLIDRKVVRDGRLLYTIFPINAKTLIPIKVITQSQNEDIRPKGTYMPYNDYIRILPEDSKKWFANISKKLEESSALNSIVDAQKEGIARQKMHLKNLGEGEISEVQMNLIAAFTEKLLKSGTKEEKQQYRPGAYPPTTGQRDMY